MPRCLKSVYVNSENALAWTKIVALPLNSMRTFPMASRWGSRGAIGRLFKIVTALEDSGPLPDGYKSVGLLPDMSVHNVDEVPWFFGDMPTSAVSSGSRIYAYPLTTADEDFDDASIELRCPRNRLARITANRNHVSGYRVENWIYSELGQIHIVGFARGDASRWRTGHAGDRCREERGRLIGLWNDYSGR